MSHIHFIGGEKGGVGKSVMARLLAQYYIDHDIPFKGYDADLSHGAMLRYYKDYAEALDITRFEDADRIIERAAENGVSAIIDLAAQASKSLHRWIDDTGLIDLAGELGLNLTFWHVMDDGADSLKLLKQLFESYGEDAEYVVVCNRGRGADFSHLSKPETSALLQQYGAKMVILPALHPPAMRKIDHISASFWAATNNTDREQGPTLGLLERQRVRTWLHKVYEQLNHLHEELEETALPEAEAEDNLA